MNRRRSVFKFLLFCHLSFVICLISCSDPTSSNNVTFSGTVILEDTTDYSGVTVSLYKPVELDTALVRINQEYPNIGVQISQETEFDHREHEPVYTTITNADGNWEIKKVEEREYNVVAEKDSFGWIYKFNVVNTDGINLTLYKENELEGQLPNNLRLMAFHHYIVKDDIEILEGDKIQIDEGAWIRFDGSYKFEIYGDLDLNGTESEYIKFTSNLENTEENKWRFIRFNQVNYPIISFVHLSFSGSGMRFEGCENITVGNSIFEKCSLNGIIIKQSSECILENIIIRNTLDACLMQYTLNAEIKNNIFNQNRRGIKFEYSGNHVKNNYFYSNETGVYSLAKPSADITHNEFENNQRGVFCAGSDPVIRSNNFDLHEQSIFIGYERNHAGAQPMINFNNLINNTIGIALYGSQGGANTKDIDGRNNWWGTIAEYTIDQQLVWDKNDEGADSIYTGTVYFKPYCENLIDTVGIQF